jgi:hypothetical protein
MTGGAGHDRYDTIDACAYPDAFSLLRSTCIVQHFVSFRFMQMQSRAER